MHAEFIVGADGIVANDLAPRGGGVLIYPLVLSHLCGGDVAGAAIGLVLGRAPALPSSPPELIANIEFLRAPPGRIVAIRGVEAARASPGVAAVHLNLREGDHVGALQHKDQRLGFIVTLGTDADQTVASGRQAAALIEVDQEE